MHLLRPHLKLQKCGFLMNSKGQKALKPLKTLGFRVLADASKLATLANTKKSPPIGGLFFALLRPLCGLEPPPPLLLSSLYKTVVRWRRMSLLLAKCCCSSSKAFFKRGGFAAKAVQRPIVRGSAAKAVQRPVINISTKQKERGLKPRSFCLLSVL